jgi:hypothetical protein
MMCVFQNERRFEKGSKRQRKKSKIKTSSWHFGWREKEPNTISQIGIT